MHNNDRVNDVALNRVCANCKWRSDEFMSVCVNDESEHLADFVEAEGTCECWENVGDDKPLPCPFCGGDTRIDEVYAFNDLIVTTVTCNKCGANLSSDGHRKAIAAWNRRSGIRECGE